MIDNQRYVMKEKEKKRGNFESSGGTGKTGARIKRASAAHSTLHRCRHPPPDRHRPKSQAFGSHPVLCSYKTSPCNTHACKQDTVTDTNQSSSNIRNPLSPYSLGLCDGLVCMPTTFRRCGDVTCAFNSNDGNLQYVRNGITQKARRTLGQRQEQGRFYGMDVRMHRGSGE